MDARATVVYTYIETTIYFIKQYAIYLCALSVIL